MIKKISCTFKDVWYDKAIVIIKNKNKYGRKTFYS